jgi:hypothetical protein
MTTADDEGLAAAMTYIAAGLDEYADERRGFGDAKTVNEVTELAATLRTIATRMAPPGTEGR